MCEKNLSSVAMLGEARVMRIWEAVWKGAVQFTELVNPVGPREKVQVPRI